MPAQSAEFAAVFGQLRAILARYEPKLNVVHDTPKQYFLDTHTIGPSRRPIAFGGVKVGKGYVSFYLMPIYSAEVKVGMSPALKQRMQGKACFNFRQVDDVLFAELERVTRQCYAVWKKIEWVD
ncbi:MAG TPA: hypothetical protein VN651_13530 [Gemmatimonadaceae bacterium]|nr:hypothetical protein [Gemmatimonadaceae bacterium]